jgi:hypothetical protein
MLIPVLYDTDRISRPIILKIVIKLIPVIFTYDIIIIEKKDGNLN